MSAPMTTVQALCLREGDGFPGCGARTEKALRAVLATWQNRRCTNCNAVLPLKSWRLPDGQALDTVVEKACDRCGKEFKSEAYKTFCRDCFRATPRFNNRGTR